MCWVGCQPHRQRAARACMQCNCTGCMLPRRADLAFACFCSWFESVWRCFGDANGCMSKVIFAEFTPGQACNRNTPAAVSNTLPHMRLTLPHMHTDQPMMIPLVSKMLPTAMCSDTQGACRMLLPVPAHSTATRANAPSQTWAPPLTCCPLPSSACENRSSVAAPLLHMQHPAPAHHG